MAEHTPTLQLADRASFLLSALGSRSAREFADRLAPLGMRPSHFGLLTHLSRDEGQSQQHVADVMGIHRNVMVGLVDDLEGRGLIERRRQPADRRAHALHLTAAAHELLSRAQRAADEQERHLLDGIEEAERTRLIALLQRLAEHTGLSQGVHPGLREHDSTPTRSRS
ncbi:MAG: MarR family winged helix-turn-helix transcriptional regulator [Sciscionella sp.]